MYITRRRQKGVLNNRTTEKEGVTFHRLTNDCNLLIVYGGAYFQLKFKFELKYDYPNRVYEYEVVDGEFPNLNGKKFYPYGKLLNAIIKELKGEIDD